MGNERAIVVKARAVLRSLGHSEGDSHREYQDWHIEIRSGLAYVSIWSSGGMVFLALGQIPVFYRPGPWEQYLDRLFQRSAMNGRQYAPAAVPRLPAQYPPEHETSEDS